LTVPVGRSTDAQFAEGSHHELVRLSSMTHNPEKLAVAVPFDPPVFHVTVFFIVPSQPLQPAVPSGPGW
jgi:hypothetical protein